MTTADPQQVVLESDPYRRLAFTWLAHTPELAQLFGQSEEVVARILRERRSKVTFEIEPLAHAVKLSVVHDDLEPGGLTQEMISGGWPEALSSLKSLLETGEPLPLD